MREDRVLEVLRAKLDQNMDAYKTDLMQLNPGTIISKSREIYASQIVYNELYTGEYQMEQYEYLLQFEKPLEVVRDQWLQSQFVFTHDEMEDVLSELIYDSDAKQIYELDTEYDLDPEHELSNHFEELSLS